MTTLMIKDLSVTAELDRSAMASVRGGTSKGYERMPYYSMPDCWTPPSYGGSPTSFSFDATQSIGQSQNVLNNNGNNAAFVSGITSTVNPTQTANNNINF
jgi:hypothetical protein